jgi:periplasmic protein TonB
LPIANCRRPWRAVGNYQLLSMMQASIFEEREKWSGAVLLSAGLHVLLALTIIVTAYFRVSRGQNWGGETSGDAISASLVSAVPLPAPQVQTQNIVATENKGLTQTVPEKAQEQPDAIPIPEKDVKRKPERTITQPQQKPRPVTPPQNNVVPYGEGGQINTSFGNFSVGNVQAGFNPQGDFGTRFAYWVTGMKNIVSSNWYNTEIGAGAQGHKAFVSFDVARDGTPSNIRLEQSSGIPALDQSAVRAIQRSSDGFGRLPDAYAGSSLHVELWFNPPR